MKTVRCHSCRRSARAGVLLVTLVHGRRWLPVWDYVAGRQARAGWRERTHGADLDVGQRSFHRCLDLRDCYEYQREQAEKRRALRLVEPPFADRTHGCKWCGGRIASGRKDRRWHDGRKAPGCPEEPDCRREYLILTETSLAIPALAKRDGCRCRGCGSILGHWVQWAHWEGERRFIVTIKGGLEVDHKRPLADGGANDFANLQLLCTSCHRDKTGRENSARARRRREGVAA